MAATPAEEERCPILDLPVELRLEIYAHAIRDSRHITIGTTKLQGAHADIVHRLYGEKRTPYAGIPMGAEPCVETEYRAALLSPVTPATLELAPATAHPAEDAYRHTQTAHQSLSLTNKQFYHELRTHFSQPTRRQSSLFVQYPHGLHILHTTTPQLLRQARSLHLAGTYIPRAYCPPRAACMGTRSGPNQEKLQGDLMPDHAAQLASLIKSCFGSNPRHRVEKLEMRVYYPGEDSYSTVWGDEDSPIVLALRNISLGEVGIEIWRGRYGTGVYLTAKPATERERVVSTVWRRLNEGRHGEPACGNWICDANWPSWSAEYEASEGPRGDTIISVPRD